MSSDYCKCPNCEGKLEYRADYRKFGCRSCQSFFTDEQIKKMFKGKNRSGSELMSETEDSPSPEYIIPFETDKNRALEIFRENTETGKFIPSDLYQQASESITGVYVPVWMADCSVSIKMNGTGKKVKIWICGSHRYTETKEFSVERKAEAEYCSVISDADGFSESDFRFMPESYDFGKMRKFTPDELGHFKAEYCTVDKGKSFERVRRTVTDDVRKTLEKSVSEYFEFSPVNEDIDILNTDWYYTLIPVWFLTYNANGREYRFAVNGQNGKFMGKPPASFKKIALFGAATVLVLTMIYSVIMFLTGFAGDASQNGYFMKSTGLGIVFGILASAVSCLGIVKKYKRSEEYTPEKSEPDGETNFSVRYDRYVRQYTTKVIEEE